MFIYTIKKDGFALGQAKGLNEAIRRVKYQLELFNITEAKWLPDNPAKCQTNDGLFTIERSYDN